MVGSNGVTRSTAFRPLLLHDACSLGRNGCRLTTRIWTPPGDQARAVSDLLLLQALGGRGACRFGTGSMVMRGGRDGTRIYGLFCWSQHGLRARMKSAHGKPIAEQRLLRASGVIGFAPCRSDRAHLLHLSRSLAGK